MISLPVVDIPVKNINFEDHPNLQKSIQNDPDTYLRKVPEYNLRTYLNTLLPFPLRTGFLGVDQGENPLFFDLMDPRPGSILIVADHDSGKLRLLKTLIYSLILANPPYEIQFSLISARITQWKYEFDRFRNYFSHFTNNYDHPAGRAILDEADRVESRQHGRNIGECRLLVVDGFDTLPYMDFDVRLNFEWLLEEGPYFEVWPIVIMDSRTAAEQKTWVEKFKTRIIGKMRDESLASSISNLTAIKSNSFIRGKEFCVRISNREHHFYLPDSI